MVLQMNEKKAEDRKTVMNKNLFDIVIVGDGSVFYSNFTGIKIKQN